jgi:hypothetical protein
MKSIVALPVPSFTASVAKAQTGHDPRGDGADARADAPGGTPDRAAPLAQTNLVSTAPGPEQQASGPSGKGPPKDPSAPGAGTKP